MPVLSESRTLRLLEELCVELGFCLPEREQERLTNDPPGNAGGLHEDRVPH